jgi:pimeloyl-ACP methyl ester carboxylesterase
MIRRLFVAVLVALSAVALIEAQAAREDKFFDSKGLKIRYVDVGQGEPVVLIHGFSSSLDANWGSFGIIDKLAKEFRVIAIDVRGHGLSDKPHDPAAYGMEAVEDITRLLDHLHVPRAHIAGYSMGGVITGKFITVHPDRTISAIFGGSAPRVGMTPQAERDAEELASSLEHGQGLRPLILRLSPPGEPKPSDELIAQRSREILGRNDPLALAAVQRGNKTLAVTAADVKAFKMPLLAIVGGRDPIKAGVDLFKQMKPDVQVVVIDGATHSGAQAAPARPEFFAAMRDFLIAHRRTMSQ